VGLVFDPSQGRLDKYGRTLAYLQIPHRGDFGLIMVRRGNAAEYTYDTAYQRQAGYLTAERVARRAGRGLWGACGGPDTPLHQPTPTPTPTPTPQQVTGGGSCEPDGLGCES
jgi:micrococcal nuclease